MYIPDEKWPFEYGSKPFKDCVYDDCHIVNGNHHEINEITFRNYDAVIIDTNNVTKPLTFLDKREPNLLVIKLSFECPESDLLGLRIWDKKTGMS